MPRAPQQDRSDLASRTAADAYVGAWDATMQLLRQGHSFSGRERNCAFLNCGPELRFANVSAVTGLDFADDGRVIATVDWDHDGDLDVWLHNRTGPRLRLMQNQTIDASKATSALTSSDISKSLEIRLQGTTTNRDGIGARVELLFENPGTSPMVQTLYAGDAFLSQSSKWLHFGLGAEQNGVRGIRVRWPGGKFEEFFGVRIGKRHLLVEGTGRAEPQEEHREVALVATDQRQLLAEDSTRIPLFSRPVLPILHVRTIEDGREQDLKLSARPTLLVLWASWCTTCQRELQELSQRKNELDVIAIAVDETAVSKPAENVLTEIVTRWRLEFPVVMATPETLDKLELLSRVVLNREIPLAVPTSYLVDKEGRMAAVYRGALDLHQLVADVDALDEPDLIRRDRVLPFAGKWTTPPSTLLMRPVASIFRDRGYDEDYAKYLAMEMAALEGRRAAAATAEQRELLDHQWAADNFNLAIACEHQQKFGEAIEYYRQGLQAAPTDVQAHLNMARCLQQMGDLDLATDELKRAVSKVSNSVELRLALAKQLRASNEFGNAEEQLREAIRIEGNSAPAHFSLGALQLVQGNVVDAERSFRAALNANPDHFESLLNLGALMASQGKPELGLENLRRALKLRPTDVTASLNLARALHATSGSIEAQRILQAVTVSEPDNAQAHLGLAQIALAMNQTVDAKSHLIAAVAINPKDRASLLRLAWLLATAQNALVRDARRAVEIASELDRTHEGQHPIVLDTLAAAYAAAGDFDKAVSIAARAVSILTEAEQIQMAQEVRARLGLYRQQRPFVQLDLVTP